MIDLLDWFLSTKVRAMAYPEEDICERRNRVVMFKMEEKHSQLL